MTGKGLDKLSTLVRGASVPPSKADQKEQDSDDAELAADMQKVLDFAAGLVGEKAGIFDLQILIEACAEELRNQIRDEAEGDDG